MTSDVSGNGAQGKGGFERPPFEIEELILQLTTAAASCCQSIQIQISDKSEWRTSLFLMQRLTWPGYVAWAEQGRRKKLANI